MKLLCDDGFIAAKPGPSGKYNYVLIFNPYHVIAKHYENSRVTEEDYLALYVRAQEIGAEDLMTTTPRSERVEKKVQQVSW
jgi:hypothetical protein